MRTRSMLPWASLLAAAVLAGCAGGGGGEESTGGGDAPTRTDDPGWTPEGIEAPNPYGGGAGGGAAPGDNATGAGGEADGTG